MNSFGYINSFLQNNPEVDQNKVVESINNLFNLTKKQIGLIDLAGDLDIETVTEIFIRINSKGVVLSQADFAMSKIAANDNYGGQELRKAIDYFSHLAVALSFISSSKTMMRILQNRLFSKNGMASFRKRRFV